MKFVKKWAAAPLLIAASLAATTPANASVEPYIGDIMTVSFGFCPRFWARADGQLLPINQNQALFSLLGTQFGGNGQTNFALPNLQSRIVIGDGQGPGLSNYSTGQTGGTQTATLTVAQMPAHSHTATVRAVGAAGNSPQPVRNRFAQSPGNSYSSTANPANFMAPDNITVDNAGGNQPFSLIKPYLAMTQCIALQGIFPSRN